MSKQENLLHLGATAARYGLTAEDLAALLRAEKTLHRWAELECGDGNNFASWAIERDEETETPYLVTHPHQGPSYRTKVTDREKSAKKRVAAILARYPDLLAVYQGDPRGCVLSIVRAADVKDLDPCNWSGRGFAVCI